MEPRGRQHANEEPWVGTARSAARSRDDFERLHEELPGRVRQLLKHLDPRAHSMRNVDKELAEFTGEERALLQSLLKWRQSFPLNHDFPRGRHQSKYKGKGRRSNHLISTEELRGFDRRSPGF